MSGCLNILATSSIRSFFECLIPEIVSANYTDGGYSDTNEEPLRVVHLYYKCTINELYNIY